MCRRCSWSISLFWCSFIPNSQPLQDSVAEQNADALLTAALARSTLWKPLRKSCGGSPTIIGRCWFSGNREDWNSEQKRRAVVPTSFKLFQKEERPYSFVLYRPHAPNSLRFYSLVSPQVITSTPSSTTNNPFQMIAKYDFTRPRPIGIENALNATLLNQVLFLSLYSLFTFFMFTLPTSWTQVSSSKMLSDLKRPNRNSCL